MNLRLSSVVVGLVAGVAALVGGYVAVSHHTDLVHPTGHYAANTQMCDPGAAQADIAVAPVEGGHQTDITLTGTPTTWVTKIIVHRQGAADTAMVVQLPPQQYFRLRIPTNGATITSLTLCAGPHEPPLQGNG